MTFASLIVGFPGETEQTVENTIQLLQEAQPTFFRGEIWYNNPRAPIYSKSKDVHEISGHGLQVAAQDDGLGAGLAKWC